MKEQNITSITKTGLCTGCGMCQTVCPEQAVQMKLLNRGWFQADINRKLCTNCGLCVKACGRNPEPEDAQYQEPQQENEFAPFLGRFKACYLGHSASIDIRWNATSGGLITSILVFCFKTGLIDCTIVASASTENPLISQASIATSEEEVLQASGSRYAPIPINAAIKKALTVGEKIAVVGLPCHFQSLKRAERHLPEVKGKIVLRLGMFCSHNASLRAADFVLLHKRLKARNVSEFNYRGQGWPSGIRIKTKQGTTAYIPNSNSIWTSLFSSFIYATPYCLSCTDQTNELADISFGDAWLPDVVERDKIGRTICITRTEIGSSVLEQAVRAKAIKITDLEPRRVVESQKWPLYFKKLNILCRKARYPENIVKVDGSLRNCRLTISDRFISCFALFASTISNWAATNKYVGYITVRLLLLPAKLHNKMLSRRTEQLMNQFLEAKQSSPKQAQPQTPLIRQPAAVGGAQEKCTNIVIVNQHGCNRGDESALRGMLYGLKKLIPGANFLVLTVSPAKDFRDIKEVEFFDTLLLLTKKKIKLLYYTLAALLHRFGFRKVSKLFNKKAYFIESLKASDMVISAPGGPYFGDLYQGLEPTCAFPIYISKLLGKPVMIYGPSQGPFDNEKRNRWRRWLLSRVDLIAVREKYSKIYLENLGVNTSSVHVTADSCLQKPVDTSLSRQIIEKEKIDTHRMLIGMVPLYKIPSTDEPGSLDVQEMAVKTLRLLGEMFDADFILIPQMYGAYVDLPSMKQIASATGLDKRIHVLPDTYDSDQQQSLIGTCDLFVSFRYHPFIFAARQAVPSVCIGYEHKAFGFAQAMKLEEYCLDLFSTTPEEIVEKAQQAWANKDDFRKQAKINILNLERLALKNSALAAELLASHEAKKKGKASHSSWSFSDFLGALAQTKKMITKAKKILRVFTIITRALLWLLFSPQKRKFAKISATYKCGGISLCLSRAVERFGGEEPHLFHNFFILVRTLWWFFSSIDRERLAKIWLVYKFGGIALCWHRAAEKFCKCESKSIINAASESNWHPLTFPQFDKVTVSIVIPMHNKCLYSFTCLKSILCNTSNINYEVIAVDDGSKDDTPQMLKQCKNIRTITNKKAKGFVLSCNIGIQQAQGKYILLLNNDTKATNGWLDALLKPFRLEPNTGLVGAKLIYPNGTLQEAGGVIWNDASGWNYGRGDDPAKPEYCYVREVDYCSGAAILVRKDILEKLGGLDLRYVPAYYEDTDLAFTVRRLGFKVVFQPFSRVIHYEGVTCGKSVSAGIKKFEAINRAKFQEKWQDALSKQFGPGQKIYLARERRRQKRILVIDHYVPEHDKDSGSMRMSWIIKILNELGYKVIFWPDDLRRREPYTSRLQQMGVEVIYGRNSLHRYLAKNGKYVDLVWICRRDIAWKYHKTVRRLTNAPTFFDTIDLHYLREIRQAKISGKRTLIKSAQKSKKMELDLASNSDVTLVVSPIEKKLLEEEGISNVKILSNIHTVSVSTDSLDGRRDLMFIGGFVHLPNVDAIMWFVNSIWPSIKKILPDIKFYIVGSSPPYRIKELANTDIIVTGYQKDVKPYFQRSRVFACPLRYGSGIKGKIGHSMSMGLPVVTTSIGAEGMGLVHEENALIADDEDSFARNIVRLYTCGELWEKLSSNGISHVKKLYSPEVAKKRIQTLIEAVIFGRGKYEAKNQKSIR